MSKEELYEFIKKETLNKKKDGEQVKILADDMLRSLSINEPTLYANLRIVAKESDVFFKTFKVRRTQNGKTFTFEQKFYWVENVD